MGKLCECGCGDPVNNLSARFIRGHHNRSQEIKEQKKKTNLQRWGTEYASQSSEAKEKSRQTCLKKYG